jgi:ubiquinone/menaquinone biosynthesis C-methylase UbiE
MHEHGSLGIRFLCGDATLLPFADEAFDVVVNVEASHCYPDFRKFLAEVRRVLRPGGSLLMADMRKDHTLEAWRGDIDGSGLEKVAEEEITEHVVRALESTSDRVSALIRESAPRLTRRFFGHFAATKGTSVYNRLKSGELRYVRFALRKS